MRRLLYLILRKNIIKRLMEKHGDQFTNDVLKTFGLKEMPPTQFGRAAKAIDTSKFKRCCNQAMELRTKPLNPRNGQIVEIVYQCQKCKKELPADNVFNQPPLPEL